MGRGRKGDGVDPRGGAIRIRFTWLGQRCQETLARPPTPPNLKYAQRLVADIRRAIDLGSFRYAEFFPDSPRAKTPATAAAPRTFGQYCDLFLTGCSGKAAATRSQYANELKRWRERLGADTDMAAIRHSTMVAKVGAVAFPSAKMRNNSLIPLRAVFDLWVGDDRAQRSNPMQGIENVKVQAALPDPFRLDEVELILTDLAGHYDARVALYFEFAFFTGLRPEEQIALRWDKIEPRRREMLIDRARTFKGQEKQVKTGVARMVELNTRALGVLERMRRWSALKPHGHVFENPVTGAPWHDERSQRDQYWKPMLRRLRLRERPPYQTRSTFISSSLAAGANPGWLADQAGHSVAMMWKAYARWIEGSDRGRERDKLDAWLAGQKPPGE